MHILGEWSRRNQWDIKAISPISVMSNSRESRAMNAAPRKKSYSQEVFTLWPACVCVLARTPACVCGLCFYNIVLPYMAKNMIIACYIFN